MFSPLQELGGAPEGVYGYPISFTEAILAPKGMHPKWRNISTLAKAPQTVEFKCRMEQCGATCPQHLRITKTVHGRVAGFLARPVGDAPTVPTPEWLAAAGILHAVIHVILPSVCESLRMNVL
ncbi:hypothetical protein An11g07130 [Aspergillus niger]|uniref:Uncharacterized protein n=2 Tax=Aspergillus niger TaxID=5061 RepID=A2QX07_ASPNC|nr:hypothetical protein An11g07130 [Aspergillus niger]CAK97009.1 hypothetical protein An11g07130 [Aspergillus niger]